MKSEILHILREQGSYVSGQQLCEKFGVSRTAVWKAINQLKEEGYVIEAVPNKGYHIVSGPDAVSAEEVKSRLETKWIGRHVKYFSCIDSTNNYAKKIAEAGAENGTLVIADMQDGGKGRRGRTWSSVSKTSVAMTLVIRPQMRPEMASMLTLVMGMAVARSCRELYQVDARIKWPNDIVVNGKKLCGILTEMSTELGAINYLVIGAGINSNMKFLPDEIKDVATSLYLETGREIQRAELIARCLKHFERYYEIYTVTNDMSQLMDEYNELLVNRNGSVRVLDPRGEYDGISLGINQKGELQVIKEDGTQESVYAGEVSVRGIYGYV